MTRRAPNECPRCRSRQVERFSNSTLYDCGFALFDDGTSVADDYPGECNYRRIKLLEHQLSRSRAEAERWQAMYEALRSRVATLADEIGESAREAWRQWGADADRGQWGRAVGLEQAEQMVRRLLAEAGGGSQ